MASSAVDTAVRAYVAAHWTYTPIFATNDDEGVPTDGSAFLLVQFPLGTEEQITIGAPGSEVFRESGAILVILAIPIGSGLNPTASPWMDRLDALRAALRAKQFNDVNTWSSDPPVLDEGNEAGAYFKLTFATAYYYDIFA